MLAAPTLFALRRLRARPFATLALTLGLAAAGALIGWSSLTAAVSQEKSVRLHLGDLGRGARSLRVVYYTLPGEADVRAPKVEAALAGFSSVTGRVRRLQIWHSLDANNPLGMRLVIAREPGDVMVTSGRLPSGCSGRVCDALALRGRASIGERIPLGKRRFARVVGLGTLRRGVLGDTSQLGNRALLVHALTPAIHPLVTEDGSTVVYSTPLDPARVRGYALPTLTNDLRAAVVRLERGDALLTATAPLGVLDGLAERGRVARGRLLIVASEAAALIVGFAVFVASARRRETELAGQQLMTLGASRVQVRIAQTVEVAVPSIAALVLALAFAFGDALRLASGLPFAFVRAAVGFETIAVIAGTTAVAALLLVVARAPARPSRLRAGALELAAVTAFGLLVWQTWTTGALDPARVGGRDEPVVLLLPALAFFASGVVLLRLLPLVLRAAERGSRATPFGVRLALLTAARNPGQAAAATTFLAIALGACLFSLDYRATLERQARDQARFAVGASWRVVPRGPSATGVTPLVKGATPVLRLDGDVVQTSQLPLTALALPSSRLADMVGWRSSFSALSRVQIAKRLRPRPVLLAGPRLARNARAVRVWARSQTDYPRRIVLHLLLPGERFTVVTLGTVWRRWQLLQQPLPAAARDAQLIGVEFVPTKTPIDFKYDPTGHVDLGPIEVRTAEWRPSPSLARWTQTTLPNGTSGILNAWSFRRAPVATGIRFDLNGTYAPLIHPSFGLPAPLPGFETGAIPALASRSVAAQAVDGLLTLDLPGKQVPVRIVGTAKLFPTVVNRPGSFVVLDYETLFAALNADQPGLAMPTEAWFFRLPPQHVAARLRTLGVQPLETRLLSDPLASGTRKVLGVSALLAALLGVAGLLLAVRSTLESERLLTVEYEALGVQPRSLRRAAQVRLAGLAVFGTGAGLLGAVLSVRLIAAFVAVTGTAGRPLPSIVPVVPWPTVGWVVAGIGVVGTGAAALLAGRALHETAARRLRA